MQVPVPVMYYARVRDVGIGERHWRKQYVIGPLDLTVREATHAEAPVFVTHDRCVVDEYDWLATGVLVYSHVIARAFAGGERTLRSYSGKLYQMAATNGRECLKEGAKNVTVRPDDPFMRTLAKGESYCIRSDAEGCLFRQADVYAAQASAQTKADTLLLVGDELWVQAEEPTLTMDLRHGRVEVSILSKGAQGYYRLDQLGLALEHARHRFPGVPLSDLPKITFVGTDDVLSFDPRRRFLGVAYNMARYASGAGDDATMDIQDAYATYMEDGTDEAFDAAVKALRDLDSRLGGSAASEALRVLETFLAIQGAATHEDAADFALLAMS